MSTALAMWGLAAAPAIAAPYSAGDLLLGFHATSGTGSSTDYIVDLGSSLSLRDGTLTGNLANLGMDLTNTYGSGWFSRSDLYWGLIGIREKYDPDFGTVVSGDPSGTLYASFNSSTSEAVISAGYTAFAGMANLFNGLAASPNASNASFSTSSDSPAQIWTAQNPQPGATSFGNALPNLEKTLATSNQIDVYRYLSTTTGDTFGGSVGQPNFVGSLSIDSNGVVNVVPEPASGLLVLVGLAALVHRRRRVS